MDRRIRVSRSSKIRMLWISNCQANAASLKMTNTYITTPVPCQNKELFLASWRLSTLFSRSNHWETNVVVAFLLLCQKCDEQK